MIYARFRYRSELYISSIQLQLANKVATKSRMIYDIYITTKISFLCERRYILFFFLFPLLSQGTTILCSRSLQSSLQSISSQTDDKKKDLTFTERLNSSWSFRQIKLFNPSTPIEKWTIRNTVEIPLQTDTMIMAIILGSWPLPFGVQRSWAITRPTKIYTAEGKRERRERRRTTPFLSYSDIAYI